VKLGIEKKEERWKAIVFGILVLVMAVALYTNSTSSSGSSSPDVKTAAPAPNPAVPLTGGAPPPLPTRRTLGGRAAGDFHPKLRDNRPENRLDPAKVDPTIKLDLLAKVQNVPLEGGSRNIFQFGAAPPPPGPSGPIKNVPKIDVSKAIPAPPIKPPGPPPEPAAPPIPLKYYGFSSIKGDPKKRAFFLDGEEIIVAWEGEMVKNRYRVVHVGVNSVDMEDTQFKSKQSLPLAEDVAG
jgi:hypothetical protein